MIDYCAPLACTERYLHHHHQQHSNRPNRDDDDDDDAAAAAAADVDIMAIAEPNQPLTPASSYNFAAFRSKVARCSKEAGVDGDR